MPTKQTYPDWFLWLWERGFVVGSVIGLFLLVIVLAVAYYMEQRLEHIEEQLTYEPPRRHEPLDVDAYAADDIPAQSVAVERQVYVPIYSHVYHDGGRPVLLEATLSIRNTDLKHPLYVRSVRYYDTKGKLVKTYVDRLIRLGPLETVEFLVVKRDASGGSGANFIVDWLATDKIEEPVIEAVMVGLGSTQAISFRSSGRVLGAVDGQ